MLSLLQLIFISLNIIFKGNYHLAPTRHNIYLPFFWVPFIYFLTFLIEKFEYLFKSHKINLIITPILIVYIIGLNLSNNAIAYSKYQKNKLII